VRNDLETPPDLRLPRITAGDRWIVGAAIHDGHGRIFMQRRSGDRGLFPGAWDLAGGHLEEGEDILECLQREVAEETGWRVRRVEANLGELEWTGDDGVARHEVDFLVEVDGDLQHPLIETALHADPRWVDRDQALALLDGSHVSDALLRPIIELAFEAMPKR
jgi:8-oxo-dGTP diphosphatase